MITVEYTAYDRYAEQALKHIGVALQSTGSYRDEQFDLAYRYALQMDKASATPAHRAVARNIKRAIRDSRLYVSRE